MVMRLCSGPGCGRAVPENVRYCDECKPDAPRKLTRVERAHDDPIMREYGTAHWQRLRQQALARQPFCECGNAAVVGDHDIPVKLLVRVCRALKLFPFQKRPGFYIIENIKGLCHGCHNVKTKTEDSKDWTEQLVKVLSRFLPSELGDDAKRAKILAAYGRM